MSPTFLEKNKLHLCIIQEGLLNVSKRDSQVYARISTRGVGGYMFIYTLLSSKKERKKKNIYTVKREHNNKKKKRSIYET